MLETLKVLLLRVLLYTVQLSRFSNLCFEIGLKLDPKVLGEVCAMSYYQCSSLISQVCGKMSIWEWVKQFVRRWCLTR